MANASDMFRIMSYNIKCADCGPCGDNCWDKRQDLVVSMLRFHHAGIIGMQEVTKNQLVYLKDLFPRFDYVGEGRERNGDGEYCPIFYWRDQFTYEAKGQFWLSATPNEAGTKSWGNNLPSSDLPRIVTWAKFTDTVTQKTFYHFNTQFDLVAEARRESASLLLKKVEEIAKETSVLVTGDFNCRAGADPPYNQPYRILVGEEHLGNKIYPPLTDAQFIATFKHHGPSTTYLDNFTTARPGNKIDFIFIKNKVRVVNHGVLADHFDGKYGSDHMPVVADLIIEQS